MQMFHFYVSVLSRLLKLFYVTVLIKRQILNSVLYSRDFQFKFNMSYFIVL